MAGLNSNARKARPTRQYDGIHMPHFASLDPDTHPLTDLYGTGKLLRLLEEVLNRYAAQRRDLFGEIIYRISKCQKTNKLERHRQLLQGYGDSDFVAENASCDLDRSREIIFVAHTPPDNKEVLPLADGGNCTSPTGAILPALARALAQLTCCTVTMVVRLLVVATSPDLKTDTFRAATGRRVARARRIRHAQAPKGTAGRDLVGTGKS